MPDAHKKSDYTVFCHNVDEKLSELDLKIAELAGANMMKQAKMGPELLKNVVDLIRDLRDEIRSKF